MTRTPAILRDLYAWHRAALAGLKPQVTHEPQCGFFRRRLVKGGPLVPCQIWLDQPIDEETGELIGDEVLRCEVDGRERDAVDEWSWICADPITEAEFRHMVDDAKWLRENKPGAPEANPMQPVLSRTIPQLF